MDFSKAFDKVSHCHLVAKLRSYGICGRTSKWIQCFLEGLRWKILRQYRCSFRCAWRVCSWPLFVSILHHSMTCLTLSSIVGLFTDSTIVYLAIHSDADSQVLQKDLNKLANWEMLWKMRSAESRAQTRFNLSWLHTPWKILATANIGVTIASNLWWNEHVNNITNKAKRTLGLLKRNLKIRQIYFHQEYHIQYNSLIHPSLEYACSVWDPYTQVSIDKLEMVQRRAARFRPEQLWLQLKCVRNVH